MGAEAPPSIKLYPYFKEAEENQDKQGGHCPGTWEKGRRFKQLSKRKSLTIPQVQHDDLSFYQNAI